MRKCMTSQKVCTHWAFCQGLVAVIRRYAMHECPPSLSKAFLRKVTSRMFQSDMRCMMRAASLQAGTPHLNSWRRPSQKLTSCESSWRLCVQSARRQRRASPALSRLFPGLRARCRLSAMRETALSSKSLSPRCPSAPALVSNSQKKLFFLKMLQGPLQAMHCAQNYHKANSMLAGVRLAPTPASVAAD